MSGHRVPRVVLATLVLMLALSANASAQNKPYSVVISPSTVAGDTSGVDMTATFTNLTRNQTLGSANLTPPPGFAVTSATGDRGDVTVVGNVVRLRNLSLPFNSSVEVDMEVDTPGCVGPSTWSVLAKQANDFNGTGNDFTLRDSALTTTVTGGCVLDFGVEPENAEKTQTITGSPYDPAGPAVTVRVEDPDGNLVPLDGLTVSVEKTLAGLGSVSGTKSVATDDGIATFSNLSINLAGLYALTATAGGAVPDTSAPFTIVDDADQCLANNTCTASSNNTALRLNAQAAAGAESGFLTVSLNTGLPIDCRGYSEYSGWAVIDGPARDKTFLYTIPKRELKTQTDRGAAGLEMCFAFPTAFVQKPGTPLDFVENVFDFTGDGDPDDGYRGLLPDCGTAGATHCVFSRNKTGAGDGVLTLKAPAQAGDPPYRG